jgi:hypothetical protein
MSTVHGIILQSVAPGVAEEFRTDPRVAALIEPAVWIDANEEMCVAQIIERLEALAALSPFELVEGPGVAAPGREDRPILIVVVNHAGNPPDAQTYYVPDPRKEPTSWPWTNSLDDGEEE